MFASVASVPPTTPATKSYPRFVGVSALAGAANTEFLIHPIVPK